MKNFFVILLSVSILSCGEDPYPKFDIKLPSGFKTEVYKDGYNLLTASKYVNGSIESMIELRYSDDWSFSTFSNDTYIAEMLKTDKFEDISSMTFNNFKVQIKEKMYFKNLGYCFYSIYSGDYYANNVRVTNVVVQFIKGGKLYTLLGSTLPDNFSNYHKQFLNTFETFNL